MPHAVVNSAAPAKLFYQVHRPDVEEQGRCLLCQGWTAEGYLWEPQLAALLAQGFACVTFDNRGSGRSEHPLYRYTTRMLARDAMELLCAAVGWQPDSVNLVGISMGGMLALEMLAGLSEGAFRDLTPRTRFRSAALLVTQSCGWRAPRGTVPLAYPWSLLLLRLTPGLSMRARMFRSLEPIFSRRWLRAESGESHPKTGAALTNGQLLVRRGGREARAKQAEGVPPLGTLRGVLGQAAAVATHHVSADRLRRLAEHIAGACPLLVVCAGRDTMVRYEAQRRLAASLGPASPQVLDLADAYHGVTDQMRDEVNSALLRLFASAGPAGARAAASTRAGERSRL